MLERANPPALWSSWSFGYLSGLLLLQFRVSTYSRSLSLSTKSNLSLLLIIFESLGGMPLNLQASFSYHVAQICTTWSRCYLHRTAKPAKISNGSVTQSASPSLRRHSDSGQCLHLQLSMFTSSPMVFVAGKIEPQLLVTLLLSFLSTFDFTWKYCVLNSYFGLHTWTFCGRHL